MLGPIVAGVLAACVAAVSAVALRALPPGGAPALASGAAVLAALLQRLVLDRRPVGRAYDGLADLFIHVHSPSGPGSGLRWFLRGLISLALSACGGRAGPEGAAVEIGQALALRSSARSSRWFEQRRRTDASTSLAAGISAAFGAPFAGVVLPIELGVGGRYVSAFVASIAAYLVSRLLLSAAGVAAIDLGGVLYGFRLAEWRAWVGVAVIGVSGGAVSALLIHFLRHSRASLLALFGERAWLRQLAAGGLLALLLLAVVRASVPAAQVFEQAIWAQRSPAEIWILFCAGALSLSVVLAGFGTLGVFWPLFALGALWGCGVGRQLFLMLGPELTGAGAVAGLCGATAFWGAMLGAPLASSVLAFELTQNTGVLLPCLVAGHLARAVRRRLRTGSLVDGDLRSRGLALIEGRAAVVLDAVAVSEAMVTDHETVHEQESVAEIHQRLLKARYPFLPVVNSQEKYVGFLSIDVVQEAWRDRRGDPDSPLIRLLEAKDLLYRAGTRSPTVKADDRLSATAGVFEEIPCVPVLTTEGRVAGLLFNHHVRLAYDREVVRRTLVQADWED